MRKKSLCSRTYCFINSELSISTVLLIACNSASYLEQYFPHRVEYLDFVPSGYFIKTQANIYYCFESWSVCIDMDGHTIVTVHCFQSSLLEDKWVGVLVQTWVKKYCFDVGLSHNYYWWVILYLLEGLYAFWQVMFLHNDEWSLDRQKLFDSLVTFPAIYLLSVWMA